MSIQTCDVLIVRSGAAGLTAAAASHGLDTVLFESAPILGGTTSFSGGTIWIPGNPVSRFEDFRALTRPCASLRDFVTITWMALRSKAVKVFQTSLVTIGRSLIAQLLSIALKQEKMRILRSTELTELLTDGDGLHVVPVAPVTIAEGMLDGLRAAFLWIEPRGGTNYAGNHLRICGRLLLWVIKACWQVDTPASPAPPGPVTSGPHTHPS